MSKHTKGPWEVSGVYSNWIDGPNGEQIAEVMFSSIGPDANLIAAAPELLEALELMLGKAYKQNWNDGYPEILDKAEKAVDKAKGES